MPKLFAMVGLALPLAGCLGWGTDSTPRTVLVCPTIKEYVPETQAAARKELADVRRNYPVTTSFIGDYLALRDAVRTCNTEKNEK